VAIIGGGPSGCAAAIILSRVGASVVLIEDGTAGASHVGECVAPVIREPLQELGLWDEFAAGRHTPVTGISSYWGSGERSDTDFIASYYGQGWALHPVRFKAMLILGAQAAGATVISGRATRCRQRKTGLWNMVIECDGAGVDVTTAAVVNAGGRNSSIPGLLNKRRSCDRLSALVRCGDDLRRKRTNTTRLIVETCSYGWWYSLLMPGDKVLGVLLTDPDLIGNAISHREVFWQNALSSAPQTNQRLRGITQFQPIIVRNAWSSCAYPTSGINWFCSGDAALTYDPLSGQGIYLALRDGIEVAKLLLSRSPSAIERREAEIRRRFIKAQNVALNYYILEQRWPNASFWQRHHKAFGFNHGP
jgi:flavin-dependent dehydrogenase